MRLSEYLEHSHQVFTKISNYFFQHIKVSSVNKQIEKKRKNVIDRRNERQSTANSTDPAIYNRIRIKFAKGSLAVGSCCEPRGAHATETINYLCVNEFRIAHRKAESYSATGRDGEPARARSHEHYLSVGSLLGSLMNASSQ